MTRMIIFDDGKGRFGPMTDLRACFELRTGMLTTSGRIAAAWPKTLAAYWVPQRLAAIVAERANAPVNELPSDETVVCVNGRWALPHESLSPDLGQALVEPGSGHVVTARLRHSDAEYFLQTGELHERVSVSELPGERVLYRYPWDVLSFAWKTIPHDILRTRLVDATVPSTDITIIGEHPVELHDSAQIFPNVVFDATHGPIMVHERAVIRPGSVLCGPCSVGPDSSVIDRALIKPNTVIGPCCKVGGEVGGTIFQGFSNKSHDGHLGDSWVGKWVNFGAGTTNSNLLNTYGEVAMRLDPDGPRQRTGLTFLGAIVGDHAKFAINTRLMTGSVVGTGTMFAATAPLSGTTRSFAWITDEGERKFRIDRFLEVMRSVMTRRRETPSEAYIGAVRDLFERQSAGART